MNQLPPTRPPAGDFAEELDPARTPGGPASPGTSDSGPAVKTGQQPHGKAASLAVATGILLSKLIGLIRERIFAHYFGNSMAADAFKAAFRIPNMLQNLFGEGVLSASFIPVYARLNAEKRHDEATRTAGCHLCHSGAGRLVSRAHRRAPRSAAHRHHRPRL